MSAHGSNGAQKEVDSKAYHDSPSAASSNSLGRPELELGPACFARRPLHYRVWGLPHSAVLPDTLGLLPVIDRSGGLRAAERARRLNNPMGDDGRREGVPG